MSSLEKLKKALALWNIDRLVSYRLNSGEGKILFYFFSSIRLGLDMKKEPSTKSSPSETLCNITTTDQTATQKCSQFRVSKSFRIEAVKRRTAKSEFNLLLQIYIAIFRAPSEPNGATECSLSQNATC